MGLPYRIEIADGLVLRCWEPRDAPLLKDAVDSSLEHLRAWMPWAHDEPQTLDEKEAAQPPPAREPYRDRP